MPGLWDHLLLGLLVVVLPLWGLRENTQRQRDRWKASVRERRRTIVWIIAVQWVALAAMITIWISSGRPFAELDLLGPLHLRFWIGAVLAAVMIGLIALQQRAVLRDAQQREQVAAMLDRRAAFMPRSRSELPLMALLCVTAGVCEEFIYRGWLFWYLSSYFGTSALAITCVVIAAAVIFTIGHCYQDTRGMAEVFGAALIFGGLYVLMESLWVAMILHCALDFNAGLLAARIHGASNGDGQRKAPSAMLTDETPPAASSA